MANKLVNTVLGLALGGAIAYWIAGPRFEQFKMPTTEQKTTGVVRNLTEAERALNGSHLWKWLIGPMPDTSSARQYFNEAERLYAKLDANQDSKDTAVARQSREAMRHLEQQGAMARYHSLQARLYHGTH